MPIVLLVIGLNVAKMFLQWAIFVHCVYVYTNMGPLELKYLKSLAKSFAAKEERGLILSAEKFTEYSYLGFKRIQRMKAIHFFRPDCRPRNSRAKNLQNRCFVFWVKKNNAFFRKSKPLTLHIT